MVTLDTASPSRVRSAQDRVDVLVMGRAAAARHCVLRLLDPAAAKMRGAVLGGSEPSADVTTGPQSSPVGGGLAARARLAEGFAVRADEAVSAA